MASLILIACGDGAFKVNPHISFADTTMNESGFTLSLRRMRRKWEWKMSLRDPIFAQFSAGALNFQSNKQLGRQGCYDNYHIIIKIRQEVLRGGVQSAHPPLSS